MSPSSPPSSSSPIAYRNSLISTRLFFFSPRVCVCVCVCDDPRATLPGLSKRRLCLNAAA